MRLLVFRPALEEKYTSGKIFLRGRIFHRRAVEDVLAGFRGSYTTSGAEKIYRRDFFFLTHGPFSKCRCWWMWHYIQSKVYCILCYRLKLSEMLEVKKKFYYILVYQKKHLHFSIHICCSYSIHSYFSLYLMFLLFLVLLFFHSYNFL